VGAKRRQKLLARQAAQQQQRSAPASPAIPYAAAGLPRALPPMQSGASIASWLLWAFAILLMLGFVAFRIEGTLPRGNMMSVARASFTVVNAGTLTGFQQPTAVDEYQLPGQLVIFVLTAGCTLVTLIVGGLAVTRIARLPYTDRDIIVAAVVTELGAIFIGAPLLWLFGARDGALAPLLQSASAFGNSGVWLGGLPDETLARTHLVLLPLSILGGLGVPVLMDLYDVCLRKRRPELSRHTMFVVCSAAAIYLLGTALLIFVYTIAAPPQSRDALVRVIGGSSAAAINTRSAGLPINFAAEFPRTVQWVLIVLMMIGAFPGGAGGGIKGTTMARLILGVRDVFAGKAPGRGFGVAILWTAAFVALCFGSLLLLLATQPDLTPDRLVLLAVSAASNTGLSHDRVAIVGRGMAVLSATMLLGRMLPWAVLWWMATSMPEEDVAVG
jgi:Trk-type K+ transport system membrane component